MRSYSFEPLLSPCTAMCMPCVHRAMGQGYGTRNVFRLMGLGRTCVEHDHRLAILEGHLQIPRIDQFECWPTTVFKAGPYGL
jgi:hypothetical protein